MVGEWNWWWMDFKPRLLALLLKRQLTLQKLPNTDEDVAKLNEKKKNQKIVYTKSTKNTTIQIQQLFTKVHTADNDISILKDNNGEPILPSEEFRRS